MILFTSVIGGVGQKLNKEAVTKIFDEVTADEKEVAECEKFRRAAQIKQYGKPLPKIAGHCLDGCPTSLPLPYYPKEARQFKISGLVIVDTIVDEDGNVVYAKARKGKSLLRQAAVAAAYRSKYQRKITCNDRRIKFRWTIKYNFLPNEIRVYH